MPGEEFEIFDVKEKARLHGIKKEEIDLENGILGLKFLSSEGRQVLEKWISKYKEYFKKDYIICSMIRDAIDISPSGTNIDFEYVEPQDNVKGEESGVLFISKEVVKGNRLFNAYIKWYKKILELLTKDSTWDQYEKAFPDKSIELRELQKKCKEFYDFSDFSPYYLCCVFEVLNEIEGWLRNALKEVYDHISITRTAVNAIKNVVGLAASRKTLGSLDDNIYPVLLKKFKTASIDLMEDFSGFNNLLREIKKVDLNRHENFLKEYMQYLLDFLFDLFGVRKSLIQAMIVRLQVASDNEDIQDGDFLLHVVQKLNKLGVKLPLLEQNLKGLFHKITESDFNTMHQYISKSIDLIDNPQQKLRKLKWLKYDNSIKPPLIDLVDDNLRFEYRILYEYLQNKEQAITPFQIASFDLDMSSLTKIIKRLCETRTITQDKIEDSINKIESIGNVLLSFKKTKLYKELLDIFVNSIRSFFSKIHALLVIFYRLGNDVNIETKQLKIIRDLIPVLLEDKIRDKIIKEVNEINNMFNLFISDLSKVLINLINNPTRQEPEHLKEIEKLLNNIMNCVPKDKLQWFNKLKTFLTIDMDSIDYPKDHKSLKEMSTFLCNYLENELKLDKEEHVKYFNVYYLIEYLTINLSYQPSAGYSLLEDIDKNEGGGNIKKWEAMNNPAEFHKEFFQFMNGSQAYYPIKRILFCMDKLRECWGEEQYSKFEEETFERYLEDYRGNSNEKNNVFIHCKNIKCKEKYFLKRCEYLFSRNIEQLNTELSELNQDYSIIKFDILQKRLLEFVDGFIDGENLIDKLTLKNDGIHSIIKILEFIHSGDKARLNEKLDKIIHQHIEEILKNKIDLLENPENRIKFEEVIDDIWHVFPRSELGKKLFANIAKRHNKDWMPAVHLLIQKLGTEEQRSHYQLVWLENFLQRKISHNSFQFSNHLKDSNAEISMEEIYKSNFEKALNLLLDYLQKNILEARVKRVFDQYFAKQIMGKTKIICPPYNTVLQEYILCKSVEDTIRKVVKLLHNNEFKEVQYVIAYLKNQLSKPTYRLYWDRMLIPAVEGWVIAILESGNQSFSEIQTIINSFQELILTFFPNSEVEINLRFIIENSEIIHNLNRNLLNRILVPGKGKNWYHALINEKLAKEYITLIDDKSTEEVEKRLIELRCYFINSFHCIFIGTSSNFKRLLLDVLDKLPVSFMVTFEREICLLLRKLLLPLPSMNVDSVSVTNKLLDSIIAMLKLEKNGLSEYPSSLLRNHEIQGKIYNDWKKNLRVIFNDIEDNDALGIIVHSVSLGECMISPIYKDFLVFGQSSGDTLQLPPGQTHIVQQIGLPSGDKYYFKYRPDAPGDEYSVRSLYKLLLEPDMPQIDLFCFPGESGNRGYPVLASPGFKGETLDKYWNKNKSFKLDHAHFSRSVLMNLVVGPLDLKPENIIVEYVGLNGENEPQYRLRSFDNDQCFMPPTYDDVIKDKLTRRLGIKTAIFCFDEMRFSLDKNVVEEFLSINIVECLRSWIIDVTRFNGNCSRLFSSDDCEYWATLPDKKAVVLIAQLEPDLIEQLYDKLFLLQDTLNRNRHIPALDLLTIIYPELGPYYIDNFFHYELPAERFKQTVANEYILLVNNPQQGSHYLTSTSINTVAKARYGRLPNRKKEFLEPPLQLEEARINRLSSLFVQYSSIDDVVDSLLKCNSKKFDKLNCNNVKERVIERIKLSTLTKSVQLFVFRKMIGNSFRHLDFSNCEFLTAEILLKIVESSAGRLTHLKLVGCKNLEINDRLQLKQLLNHCEYLENLHIQLGRTIEAFHYARLMLFGYSLRSIELKRLAINI